MKNLGYSCHRGYHVALPWFIVLELQFFVSQINALSSYFQVHLFSSFYFLVDSGIRRAPDLKAKPRNPLKGSLDINYQILHLFREHINIFKQGWGQGAHDLAPLLVPLGGGSRCFIRKTRASRKSLETTWNTSVMWEMGGDCRKQVGSGWHWREGITNDLGKKREGF